MKRKTDDPTRLQTIGNAIERNGFEIFLLGFLVLAVVAIFLLVRGIPDTSAPEYQLEQFNARYDYCIAQENDHDYCLAFAKED